MEPSRQLKQTPLIPDHSPVQHRDLTGLTHTYSDVDGAKHSMTFRNAAGQGVGGISWKQDTGEITGIMVNPEYRGLKVATHMYEHAKKLSDAAGLVSPVHSSDRTDMGNAWAKSVGGPLPPMES